MNQLAAFQSITTRADNTNLVKVIATNLASPTAMSDIQANGLVLSLTGWNGGIANVLNANVVPCPSCKAVNPVIFNKYWTNTGTVTVAVDRLEFGNAIVSSSAQFTNNYLNVQLNSKNNSSPNDPFQMFLVGDQQQDNTHPTESVSKTSVNNNKYSSPFPPGQIFNYLFGYFGAKH